MVLLVAITSDGMCVPICVDVCMPVCVHMNAHTHGLYTHTPAPTWQMLLSVVPGGAPAI